MFRKVQLAENHVMYTGFLPEELTCDEELFQQLWDLHPEEFHDIRIHGKLLKTPRWQQAYNRNYQYSGSSNQALPVPDLLMPYWTWAKEQVNPGFNGLLLNWYDGALGHYIGKHRDSIQGMLPESPILTISLGETRTFRMRPWKGTGYLDFIMQNGSAILIPYQTNLYWTHEVPASRKLQGRRISITFRVFEG